MPSLMFVYTINMLYFVHIYTTYILWDLMDSNHSLADQIYSLAAGSNQLSVPICTHICLLFTIKSQPICLLYLVGLLRIELRLAELQPAALTTLAIDPNIRHKKTS